MKNSLLYSYQFLRDVYDNMFSNKCNEEKILKKYLKKKIIFFDIGYNLGFETNKLKKKFSERNLNIPALAPTPASNNTRPTDRNFNNLAITSQKLPQVKFIIKNISSSSGLEKYVKKERNDKIINVRTIKLSDYCKKNKIRLIDYMKIDVEGAELECLESLENFIYKLRLLKIELTSKNFLKTIYYLDKKSFKFLGIINTKYINNEFSCSNAFFINEKYKI